MENIIIRNIKEEDIPSIINIQIKGWQEAYKNIVDPSFLNNMDNDSERKIKRMQETYMDSGFVVAELNNEIVGYCRYRYDNERSLELENVDCEICAIYVKPELKGKGIGTKLFEYVKNDLKSKNKESMFLWCLKDNEKSKNFYAKMGGKIISEQEVQIGDRNYLEVCFVYDISKNKFKHEENNREINIKNYGIHR